jgi:hypothetical protein
MGRVWTYVISKELNADQLHSLLEEGKAFVQGWTAHEQQLSGSFELFKNKIIVVKVDEEVQGASGCSIDKLTRFVKATEGKYGIELLNRLLVALKVEEDVQIVHSVKIKDLLDDAFINENSVVYNTSVANSDELKNWEQPLKETWLKKYLQKV